MNSFLNFRGRSLSRIRIIAADLPYFLENIYNATHLHAAPGYLSPNRFEEINAPDGSIKVS